MKGPTVKLSEQYAQTIRDTSAGKQAGKIDPANQIYHITGGDKNMAKQLARHGPDVLYAHIMKAAFDPVYGREMSIATQEFEKPQTRFPTAEQMREHDRSENNLSPAKVYKIADHPAFKPKNNQQEGKKKDDPYSFYQRYQKGYRTTTITYGQRTKKKKEKSIYSATRKEQRPESKKNYEIDFNAVNENRKTKSLYEIAEAVIAKAYGAVSKAIEYLASKGYNERPTPGAKARYALLKSGDEEYSDGIDSAATTSNPVYGKPVGYVIPDALPQIINIRALGRESGDRRKRNDLESMIAGNAIAANDNSIDGKIAA